MALKTNNMADYSIESSGDSENDISDDADYGKSVQILGSGQSSWRCILHSVKRLQNSGQVVQFCTVLNAAQQAFLCEDFTNCVKLFAVAFDQADQDISKNEQILHSSNQKKAKLSFKDQLLEAREMVGVAISRCSALAMQHYQQKDLDEEEDAVELKQSLQAILLSYGRLGIADTTLLSQASGFYLSCKEYDTALDLSDRAYALDPVSIIAQEVHENICCHLVERWHFVMLNDEFRNCSYKNAILRCIDRYPANVSVCDVGCGTGLLSLIASQHSKCHYVYAVEKMSIMANIARKVFAGNLQAECSKKIKLINKMSSRMSIPNDLPIHAHILVTETFDAGLFGEGILPTLCHAWSKLLKREGEAKSIVIPNSARLFVQAIESEAILRESRLKRDADLSGLEHGDVCISSTVCMCPSDPYTTHDLKQLPGGFRALSEPLMFMEVDFNDPKALSELNRGKFHHFPLTVTRPGRLDALAVWFSLCLLDTEEISTHTDRNGCWEQAVFPVTPCRLKENSSLDVACGDILKVSQRVKGAQHNLTVTEIVRVGNASQTDELQNVSGAQRAVEKKCLLTDTLQWCKNQVYCLSGAEITALNDTGLNQTLHTTLAMLLPGEATGVQADFIHLNSGFSPLCLQALKMGYKHVWATARDPVNQVLAWKLAQENDIDTSELSLVREPEEYCLHVMGKRGGLREGSVDPKGQDDESANQANDMGCGSSDKGSSSPHQYHEKQSQRCVAVVDVVDSQGRLVEGLPEKIAMIRDCVSQYRDVCVVPHSVDVYGVLIHSEELLSHSRVVSDKQTLGYNIASFINRFSTRNHQGIDLENVPHSKLCEPFKMFSLDLAGLLLGQEETAGRGSETNTRTVKKECLSSSTSNSRTSADNHLKQAGFSHQNSSDNRQSNDTDKYSNVIGRDSGGKLLIPGASRTNDVKDQSRPQTSMARISQGDCKQESAGPTQRAIPTESTDHRSHPEGCEKNQSEAAEGDCTDTSLDQSRDLTVCVTSSGTVTALVYWFDLHLSGGDSTVNPPSTSAFTTVRSSAGSRSPKPMDAACLENKSCDATSPLTAVSSGASIQSTLIPPAGSATPTDSSPHNTCPDAVSGPPLAAVSTRDPMHHWQQAAIMSQPGKPAKVVAAGDKLRLHCIMGSAALSFWMDD